MMNNCVLLPHSLTPGTVAEDVWMHVVWGDPKSGIFGRYSHALRLFLELHTSGCVPYVYLPNGPFVSPQGQREAEYTRDFMMARATEVDPAFAKVMDLLLRYMLLEPAVNRSTRGEVESCFKMCVAHDVHHTILITSPFHAPRSYRDALAVREEKKLKMRVTASASDTDPPGCLPSLVKIKEPRYVH